MKTKINEKPIKSSCRYRRFREGENKIKSINKRIDRMQNTYYCMLLRKNRKNKTYRGFYNKVRDKLSTEIKLLKRSWIKNHQTFGAINREKQNKRHLVFLSHREICLLRLILKRKYKKKENS